MAFFRALCGPKPTPDDEEVDLEKLKLQLDPLAAQEVHIALATESRPKVVPRGAPSLVNAGCERAASTLSPLRGPSPSPGGGGAASPCPSLDEPLVRGFKRMDSLKPRSMEALQWTASRIQLEGRLQAEQAALSRTGSSLVGHSARLAARLDRLQLDVAVAEGDGNCQFRALSEALYGSQERHGALRALAVAHMRRNRADFEAFLGEEFERYVAGMAVNGTWGDELTLRAMCDALNVAISVVTSDRRHWYLKYLPAPPSAGASASFSRSRSRGSGGQQAGGAQAAPPPPRPVPAPRAEAFLTYIAPVHYNSLKRRRPAAGADGVALSPEPRARSFASSVAHSLSSGASLGSLGSLASRQGSGWAAGLRAGSRADMPLPIPGSALSHASDAAGSPGWGSPGPGQPAAGPCASSPVRAAAGDRGGGVSSGVDGALCPPPGDGGRRPAEGRGAAEGVAGYGTPGSGGSQGGGGDDFRLGVAHEGEGEGGSDPGADPWAR